MASPAQDHHHSAPPPTPSTTQPTSDSAATDLLSRLLHRLPPSLSSSGSTPSLLRRRSSLSTTTTPPVIPFTDLNTTLSSLLPTVSQLGYFELTDHFISSELARSAESDSLSIFNLSSHQRDQYFPRCWPLGFVDDDEDDIGESLLLDSSCSTDSTELSMSSLREFTREMKKVGLAVLEALSCAMGLQNPVQDDPDAVTSLMWISRICGSFDDKMTGSGLFYPYVVGLHYQFRSQSCSLLTDTGLVPVSCKTDSILITLGDIAQVWSNGKLKKVRGKPALSVEEGSDTTSLSMSVLITLPLESTVTPLSPRAMISNDGGIDRHENKNEDCNEEGREERLFNSFSFEDYAWRVYHERLPLKDPLNRYKNKL
ncbi:hypothetical protein R6Q57_021464 [Mikania cordata]